MYVYICIYVCVLGPYIYIYIWGPAVPRASALFSATPLLLFSYIIRPCYSDGSL